MAYGTDRANSPENSPELYRQAVLEDIWVASVEGFYTECGAYWRKNGQPKAYKRNPSNARVPVKYGLYSYDTITKHDLPYLWVKLDEC